jgi:hypothetical protein
MSTSTPHPWKFFRAVGFDQVRLDTGADLMALDQLDQKLWVALACPTTGLEFDTKTLQLIDVDKDGRVRAPELIAAVQWAGNSLKNPDSLIKGSPTLPLDSIKDPALLASARQILTNLGKANATEIGLSETTDSAKIFANTRFNGDGIVPADAATDDPTRSVISDILGTQGCDTDRSAKPGISQARLDKFFDELKSYADWQSKVEADKATILPLGDATSAAAAAVVAVRSKIDDYFTRCRLAAFDPRTLTAVNRKEEEYLAITTKDLSASGAELIGFPIARVEAGRALPLKDGVNPAWNSAISTFVAAAVKPLLGDKSSLTPEDWATLNSKVSAYEAWAAAKAGASVEKLGMARVRAILASKAKDTITALIAEDKKLEPEANSIDLVDKLIRFHRDLHLLCVNFVNFKDFYDRGEPAIFQSGRLYLDSRSCDLTMRVNDAGKHGGMAPLSGIYLAYCDCTRPGGEKMQIAAAFTGGDSDQLMPGRNGIFYDRQGRDWDATISKIIDQPISIRQAFWSPYKKFVRMVEDQIAKRAMAADAAATDKLTSAAAATANADKAKPTEPKKFDVGVVAALGVAFGGITAAFGAILQTFFGLGIWMPLGLLGIVLIISGPSMLLAALKLRKRNLGPLLDANGWAINTRARINIPFGGSLTETAALPSGSERSFDDPYAEQSSPWKFWLIVGIIVILGYCWSIGKLDNFLPLEVLKKSHYSKPAATQTGTNSLPEAATAPK